MKQATIIITGTSPLLMHSARFTDPLDALTKRHRELTSKKKKTEHDHEAIAKSEWMGALYLDKSIDGPCMPTVNVKSCLVQGARLNKSGKGVERGLLPLEEKVKLEYSGPRDPEAMWKDKRFVDVRSVVVSRSRIMRYRPRFVEWALSMTVVYDPAVLQCEELNLALNNAGTLIGIGDYRPNRGGPFGRFEVELAK